MARKRKKAPVAPRADSRRPASQQERRKKRRGGKRTLHYLLLLVFLLGAGAVLSLTVFFKIEDVQVVGVDRYEPDDIVEASGIQVGDHLLRIPDDEIVDKLLGQFPYLETVKIARRFPPRVEIQVTQCVPQGAVIDEEGEIGLITMEGKLLERGDLFIPAELPLIKGLDLQGFAPGDMLGGEEHPENQEKLWMLDYLFQAAQGIDFGPITNVDVTDRLNMKMVYEARLVLELGSEADMEYKLTFLSEVIADLGPEDQARLDATNVRNKRVRVKWGRVENGVFTPLIGPAEVVYEEGQTTVIVANEEEESAPENAPESPESTTS